MVSLCLCQGVVAKDEQMWGICFSMKDFTTKILEYSGSSVGKIQTVTPQRAIKPSFKLGLC